MGVDGIGCAGNKGTVILSFHDPDVLGFLRKHNLDLVYLVSKHLIQYMEIEHIALLQLVQIREQNRTGQSTMTGQHGMGARTTDRIGGLRQMADALLQHIFAGSTVYGKIYVNFRNFDKANALAHIHQIEVADSILSLHGTGFHRCIELFIILTDRFLGSVDLFLIHFCNLLIIGSDRLTCMGLGDQVADKGIQGQTQA